MRQIGLHIVFALLFSMTMTAQNLVENGGFEKHRSCPINFTQGALKTADKWTQPNRGTPDHFSECSRDVGVPKNIFGNQSAQEGHSYAGLVTFNPAKRDYREYLQTKLKRPLRAGEKLCVEAFVSHADDAAYITDGLGFLLSAKNLKSSDDKAILEKPQLVNPPLHLLDERENWVQISDVVVAKGGEQYLTIGNFRSDKQCNILTVNPPPGQTLGGKWGYIYLDEIKVRSIKSEEECACTRDIIASQVVDPPLQLSENRSIRWSSVLFDFDASLLTMRAQNELDSLIGIMVNRTDFKMIITGHTDIVGRDGYNLDLSENRAARVIQYLTEGGIDRNRLELAFKGSEEPVAENATSEGRSQNRRVDFEVVQPAYFRYEARR